jgi:arylsulfatase A-like enzyme
VNRGAKSSIYEGGINVPLIVAGAGVAANAAATIEMTDALIHVVDVFPTVLALAGVPSPSVGIDGVSFAAVLGGTVGARSCVYADGIGNVGATPLEHPANHDVAIRDPRYKLIRRAQVQGVHDYEFYDLITDPGEAFPLPESGRSFDSLRAALERLDRDPLASPCRPTRAKWACGLGPELVALLFALEALRRRR